SAACCASLRTGRSAIIWVRVGFVDVVRAVPPHRVPVHLVPCGYGVKGDTTQPIQFDPDAFRVHADLAAQRPVAPGNSPSPSSRLLPSFAGSACDIGHTG